MPVNRTLFYKTKQTNQWIRPEFPEKKKKKEPHKPVLLTLAK